MLNQLHISQVMLNNAAAKRIGLGLITCVLLAIAMSFIHIDYPAQASVPPSTPNSHQHGTTKDSHNRTSSSNARQCCTYDNQVLWNPRKNKNLLEPSAPTAT